MTNSKGQFFFPYGLVWCFQLLRYAPIKWGFSLLITVWFKNWILALVMNVDKKSLCIFRSCFYFKALMMEAYELFPLDGNQVFIFS